jgi:hypothetical protein
MLEAIKLIDIERRTAREIRMGRGVEKAVAAELAEREFERFSAVSRSAFEGPGLKVVNQVREAWLVFRRAGTVAGDFVAVDLIDQRSQDIFCKRITSLGEQALSLQERFCLLFCGLQDEDKVAHIRI